MLHSELISGARYIYCNVGDIYIYLQKISYSSAEDDLRALNCLLSDLQAATQGERAPLIAEFEVAHPVLFQRLYGDLLAAYYSAPETAARIRDMADAGPREPSPHFDPSLLDAVITNQSGRRRL